MPGLQPGSRALIQSPWPGCQTGAQTEEAIIVRRCPHACARDDGGVVFAWWRFRFWVLSARSHSRHDHVCDYAVNFVLSARNFGLWGLGFGAGSEEFAG